MHKSGIAQHKKTSRPAGALILCLTGQYHHLFLFLSSLSYPVIITTPSTDWCGTITTPPTISNEQASGRADPNPENLGQLDLTSVSGEVGSVAVDSQPLFAAMS
ncbi:uncharacterized protein BJX67DRAFT_343986 [Aspergillus lucknowensis]|uniref:Uncharacterized protein n=1 Tax=Aspergillus lucknowensis TaxID=176173 RepID=A0ABR4M3W2_9EURO